MGVAGGRGLGTLGRHTTLSANVKGYMTFINVKCNVKTNALCIILGWELHTYKNV